MRKYNFLGKSILVEQNEDKTIIDTDCFELVINMANKAYELGRAKTEREEYEKTRKLAIKALKGEKCEK